MPRDAMIFAIGLAAGLAIVSPVLAQEIDCLTAEAQSDLNTCAERDWRAADDELNAAYGVAKVRMAEIDAGLPVAEQGASRNLREAQRAWITFRDAACTAEGYGFHGGSMEPLVVFGCLARLTAARAGDLWALTSSE